MMSNSLKTGVEKKWVVGEASISKWQILRHSGCIKQLITTSLVCSLSAFSAFVHSTLITPSTLAAVVSLIFAIVSGCYVIAMLGHLLMVTMILRGRYKIVVSKLLGISHRDKYADRTSTSNKRLEFSEFKISVNASKANEFAVGDDVVMVFANGVKYPIVIENIKTINN